MCSKKAKRNRPRNCSPGTFSKHARLHAGSQTLPHQEGMAESRSLLGHPGLYPGDGDTYTIAGATFTYPSYYAECHFSTETAKRRRQSKIGGEDSISSTHSLACGGSSSSSTADDEQRYAFKTVVLPRGDNDDLCVKGSFPKAMDKRDGGSLDVDATTPSKVSLDGPQPAGTEFLDPLLVSGARNETPFKKDLL